jgi:2-polyprenyl-6-methoxyphenol hydroxylase-like FAD-dependent oxidoreductase
MSHRYSSAVVLGASMGGLLAARALASHFARVTLVERDALPNRDEARRGVPQSNHAHGLLASGYQAMDQYFPGMMDELEALGAPRGDVVGDFLWFQYGRWKLRHDSGLRGITVSRPCLEAAIRRRVKALPNVAFLEGAEGVKPAFDTGTGRVTGLVVRSKDGTARATLGADLVVDASGRGSQSPRWLEESGCGHPEEITVKVNVGYATRTFVRKPGEFFGSMAASCQVRRRLARGTARSWPPSTLGGWSRSSAS